MDKSEVKLTRQGLLAAAFPCLGILIQALVFLLVFRGKFPPQAKAYLLVSAISAAASGLFLAVCLPDLANRQGAMRLGPSRADRRWFICYCSLATVILPATAAFELLMFRGAAFGTVGYFLGLALCASGFFLRNWAMLHNPHFVVSIAVPGEVIPALAVTGPYHWVRHPGYLAMALSSLASAFMLGSLLALLPALGLTVLLISRTIREDKFLRQGLTDYASYEGKVQHKLIPGIW